MITGIPTIGVEVDRARADGLIEVRGSITYECSSDAAADSIADELLLVLGRRRCASDAQRIALMVRDKACMGCGADASRSFSHHIQHWRNGGATDFPKQLFSQVKAVCCNSCCNTPLTQTRRSGGPAAAGWLLGLRCQQAG